MLMPIKERRGDRNGKEYCANGSGKKNSGSIL